jgi:hypothetical protein
MAFADDVRAAIAANGGRMLLSNLSNRFLPHLRPSPTKAFGKHVVEVLGAEVEVWGDLVYLST